MLARAELSQVRMENNRFFFGVWDYEAFFIKHGTFDSLSFFPISIYDYIGQLIYWVVINLANSSVLIVLVRARRSELVSQWRSTWNCDIFTTVNNSKKCSLGVHSQWKLFQLPLSFVPSLSLVTASVPK